MALTTTSKKQKITCLTWNSENLMKSKFSLKYHVDLVSPDLIFLNESQIFQHESDLALDLLRGEYSHVLNSDDLHDPELPFLKNRSNGGTIILWRKKLEKSVTILPTETTSFTAIILAFPSCPPAIHISLYLPTAGKESEFLEEITKLKVFIESALETHPDHLIFIRGDSNVNMKNTVRVEILENFKNLLNLKSVKIGHKTYHHFLGNGLFDSAIDVILHSKEESIEEVVEKVFCKSDDPSITSHHDIIVSTLFLPQSELKPKQPQHHVPMVPNTRTKIIWSEESLIDYQMIIADNLTNLRNRWLQPSSKSSLSLLLQQTSEILCSAAESTNKSIKLSNTITKKSAKIPMRIKKSLKILKQKSKLAKRFSLLDSGPSQSMKLAEDLKEAKTTYRKLVRFHAQQQRHVQDDRMYSLLSSPTSSSFVYRKIRSSKLSTTKQIPFLTVGSETYYDEDVKYGFFKSISNLKSKTNLAGLENENFMEDYKNILEICKTKRDIPKISLEESTKLLKRMKSGVIDFYGITTKHFLNAGANGVEHFNFLLNGIINEVNNATIEELNSCYALLLHKGHGKLRTSDKAYRTISTCPVVSKALDLYIRELFKHKWNQQQADTQYQGDNSCHDLAALLVTEVIQHSMYVLKEPAYLLFLDAMSAFDTVAPELLIRKLFLSGMDGQSAILVNNRLTNRITYLDWDKSILGPIRDGQGLEQGGPNSSDFYKIYSNENLSTAQKSEQGIRLGKGRNQTISAVGLADDTVLAANKLSSLANILYLTINCLKKYGVTLCAEKTRLLQITKGDHIFLENYNPIKISDKKITFTEIAEHVGIIRSSAGHNLPHILKRISCHKRAMGATLSAGTAQKSRANPLISIKLEKVYGSPVLMSGISALVMSSPELSILEKYQKETYQHLQKLHPNTPRCFIHFLSGTFPAQATVHLKMLSLFGMLARLPHDPLNTHARNVITNAKSSSKSWFLRIRDICLQYQLPHPLIILERAPDKVSFKKLVKAKITDFWELKLRGEASLLSSLLNFKPEFMSLTRPHPIWTTVGSNPYEISKAIQQARFLSGRYRSQSLVSHWAPQNREGYCLSPTCDQMKETVEHILLDCQAYNDQKRSLYSLWLSTKNPIIYQLVLEAFSSDKSYLLQFILDCSVLPSVIRATQIRATKQAILNELFYLTRTWCFSVHKQRMKNLGRWNFG